MLRSFERLQRVDLGFAPDHLLTARVGLWGEHYRAAAGARGLLHAADRRGSSADPDVSGAAGIGTVFLTATPNSTNFSIEGRPDFAPEEAVEVPVDAITPDYFRVMGIALLQGRVLRRHATPPPRRRSVIINQTMADKFWPNGEPLGRRIKYGQPASQGPWMTIVGVVADTRRTGYDAAVRPETYLPHAQSPDFGLMLVVRTTGDPAAFLPSLRAIVRQIDPGMAVQGGQSIEAVLVDMTAQRRMNTLLLSIFGVVAALLAAVGIYGVIAYSVAAAHARAERAHGAGRLRRPHSRLVVNRGRATSLAGLVVGLGAALALSRSMTSLLYKVPPGDPVTFAAIAFIAVVVALLANLVPALRAVRTDPVQALKQS